MACNPAAQVQGPGPDTGDGHPIDVNPAPGAIFPITGDVVVTDIEDGAGDSIMDAALNAAQTSVVQSVPDQDLISSGALTSAGQTVELLLHGCGITRIDIAGTFVATLVIEVREDATNWKSAFRYLDVTNDLFRDGTTVTSPRVIEIDSAGLKAARVRCSLFTSGTVNVTMAGCSDNSTVIQIVRSAPLQITTALTDAASNSPPQPRSTEGGRLVYPVYPHVYRGTSDNQWDRTRSPNTFRTVATAAAGNTALWTPAAGRRFRLMRYCVTVTGDAIQAAAGVLVISLFDGAAGATGQIHSAFVPAVAVNTQSLYTSGWIDLGNGVLSAAVNNVLNVNLSAALAGGVVNVIACGTEET